MKAGVAYGPMDIRVEELDVPVPGPGEVLVEVKAAGICGSDLHFHRSDSPTSEKGTLMNGHELSGRIAAVGDGVKNRKVGERIVVEPLLGCGECGYCTTGYYHLCKKLQFPGGGFREYTVIREEKAFPLPDHVGYEEAATLDCYTVGVHAVHRAGISVTDTVAVIGDAAIGLTALEIAKVAGARKLAITGHHEHALEVGKKLGADIGINSKVTDDVEAIMDFTHGEGCDVVFETVGGSTNTLESAVKMLKPGGKVVVIGVFTKPLTLDYRPLDRHENDIIFSFAYSYWNGVPEIAIALDLLSRGKLDAGSLITHRFPLTRIKDGFEAALNKADSGAIKVLITY